MHSKLYELVVPSWAETLLYTTCSLILLFALNAGNLWRFVLDSAGTDTATAKSIDVGFKELVTKLTTLSDPQIVNAVVWGATAALGVMLAVALASFVQATAYDARSLRAQKSELSVVKKWVIRGASLISLMIAALIAGFVLLPVFSYLFASRVVDLFGAWHNLPVAVVSILGTALSAYVLAILCRLLVLRIRVFSTYID